MVRSIRQAQDSPQVVRVRIAPSPTGIPHIGNTRTALFNYLFAKHHKGSFDLRVEDTDQKRIVPGAREAIEEILNWLGLTTDATYVQSGRLDLYREASQNLLKGKFARKEEGAVRFVVPKGKIVTWEDVVGKKTISFRSDDVEDFVILKSDGFPTYHLASVVDDHLTNVSHVIRGEEWISSTPKHLLLYEALGWEPPIFAHLPVILGSDKTKLSKRHGAKSVLDYRNEGYLREALINYMALLGWNPGGNREIMSLSEMIDLFDLNDVNTANPIFDHKKLEWMNGVYIRRAQSAELKAQILDRFERLKQIDDVTLDRLIPLAQTRMKTLNDFYELARPFFEEPKGTVSEKEREVAEALSIALSVTKQWSSGAILQILRDVITRYNIRMSVLYRIFTGKESGLPLPEMLEILGKEETVRRLKNLS